jgi:hypothetical protein
VQKYVQGARRRIALVAVVLLGIAVGMFFGRVYFVQEFLFFVGLAAVLVFIGVNLVVLGFFFKKAWVTVLQSVRKAKPGIEADQEPNAKSPAGPLAGFSTGARAAGADSPTSLSL